jgi:hypothetical protein
MRIVTLTCETEGCPNKNLAIDVETDAVQYMCGACMTLITSAVEKTDGPAEETE